MRKYSLFSSLIAVCIFFFSFSVEPNNATPDVNIEPDIINTDIVSDSDREEIEVEVPVAVLTPEVDVEARFSCPEGSLSCGQLSAPRVLKARPLQRIRKLFRR